MSTQTPNLNLDLREAADIFNPLSTNSNFETLDSVIGDIQKKGGIVTYTTTASANLLKLSDNPTPNETVFKFVAAGDANTWSYQETVNNIVSLDGVQKTVKAGEMYVAWVNAANAMVVIAWPDVVNAQTFDGKGPAEWATKVELQAVNTTATNAVTTAQAAATVANNALEVANAKATPPVWLWENEAVGTAFTPKTVNLEIPQTASELLIAVSGGNNTSRLEKIYSFTIGKNGDFGMILDMNASNADSEIFYMGYRNFSITKTGNIISALVFKAAYQLTSLGASNVNNSLIIPAKIGYR